MSQRACVFRPKALVNALQNQGLMIPSLNLNRKLRVLSRLRMRMAELMAN
jgi:hypothetical protein